MARGEAVFTAKACFQDPELVELMASAGLDGIWICLEHKRISPDTLHGLIQACRLGGADAIIRLKPSSYTDVISVLESGASGVMIPRVLDPDEVRNCVNMIKFPPQGKRGCDAIHPDSAFGRAKPAEYFAHSNRETMLVVQIEEQEVVPHLEEIASNPNVDVLFIGPGDLSLGLGKFGSIDSPEVFAVIREVGAVCRRHGKVAGIPCAAEQVEKYRALGYSFFNVFSDYRGVMAGLNQALATACKQ